MDYLIQIDSGREASRAVRIATKLVEMGGQPVGTVESRIYVFAAASERDFVLDQVRGRYGWMSASPVDRP